MALQVRSGVSPRLPPIHLSRAAHTARTMTEPPISTVALVTNWPYVRATRETATLAALANGLPVVLHLFTG